MQSHFIFAPHESLTLWENKADITFTFVLLLLFIYLFFPLTGLLETIIFYMS